MTGTTPTKPKKTTEATLTVYIEQDGEDEIVARGVTCADAMRIVAERGQGSSYYQHVGDYPTFRLYQWVLYPKEGFVPERLHATVPPTSDPAADKAAAVAIIQAQFLRDPRPYFDGCIVTDEKYDLRLERLAERREVERIDREIATKLVEALIANGYTISGDLRDDEPGFHRSTDRDGILAHMFDVEIAEFHVHKGKATRWLRMIFGESGWDLLQDYSEALSPIIDPIVDPYLPWNQPGADTSDRGYEVFVLKSPEDILAVADRLMR